MRLGGAPSEWLADNMSAIAAMGGDGRRGRDPRVERFAREAGFETAPCAPRTPETKGKVEGANRFLSRLAAYEGDFDGREGLDEAIARIGRRSNEEPNGTTGVPPELLLMREKDALGPIGNRALLESMPGDVSHQTVPATMLVRCAGRGFSVPRRMIGRRAGLVLSADGSLRAYDGGDLVAVHDTRAPGGPVVYDPAHYAEALSGKRWRADGDIEEAARRNLELLGGLGGGGAS